jgi:hypothetical protein
MNNDLIKILNELTAVWEKNNAPILDKLAPGIDISGESIPSFTGELPKEVRELYRWKNGIRTGNSQDLIGALKIFELGIFMPFDRVKLIQQEFANDELGWDAAKLPLFEGGGGEYFLIECDAALDTYGCIYYHSIGQVDFDRIISIYDSLYTLFAGVLENNKNGNYTYDAQGILEVEYDRSSQVMKALNPVSGYWKLF